LLSVLVDGRVSGCDGIGRYTRCLTASLNAQVDADFRAGILRPTGTHRYGRAEGDELLDAAVPLRAAVIHVLDYRVPLTSSNIPIVASIHDLIRLVRPSYCYSDEAFVARFGTDCAAGLLAATRALRELTDYPRGATRPPKGLHEEYYARMLALVCARAARIVTPTRTVANQLHSVLGRDQGVLPSPYGVDHLPAPTEQPEVEGRYLIYVGQTRPHKGFATLCDAYRTSRAAREGVRLVCVGPDFATDMPAARSARRHLGPLVVPRGRVDDRRLAGLYAHALGALHLAEDEGFGFPPLEALALGTSVIARDIPVLRETLGIHARFVDPSVHGAVASAIDELVSTADVAEDRERRVRWTRRYRWCRHAGDVVALYREVSAR
jgi:glycosyltransferase involved in cell wall biosynthesis